MFASFCLKNSLNLTLKVLSEVESRSCFGNSFQVCAPWCPKDILQYSRRSRGISKSSIFLVWYLEIFDLAVNLFFRFSRQWPFFTFVQKLAGHISLDWVYWANHISNHLCALRIQLVCVSCFGTSVGILVLCLTDTPKWHCNVSDGFRLMLGKQLLIFSGKNVFEF